MLLVRYNYEAVAIIEVENEICLNQVALGLMVNPPKLGDTSYNLYRREHDNVISSLKRRARLMTDMFNSLEGVVCQDTEGNGPI